MIGRGHLRPVPRPLAKCGRVYPRPLGNGVELRRDSAAKGWRLEQHRGGRLVELLLTNDELEDLVTRGCELLERSRGDE